MFFATSALLVGLHKDLRGEQKRKGGATIGVGRRVDTILAGQGMVN
jgi:hypothetical protein